MKYKQTGMQMPHIQTSRNIYIPMLMWKNILPIWNRYDVLDTKYILQPTIMHTVTVYSIHIHTICAVCIFTYVKIVWLIPVLCYIILRLKSKSSRLWQGNVTMSYGQWPLCCTFQMYMSIILQCALNYNKNSIVYRLGLV